MIKVPEEIMVSVKKQLQFIELFNTFVIIIALSFITFVSYKYGYHNGGIQQCLDLGNVKLSNGECVYDPMGLTYKKEKSTPELQNMINYKNLQNFKNTTFEVKNVTI